MKRIFLSILAIMMIILSSVERILADDAIENKTIHYIVATDEPTSDDYILYRTYQRMGYTITVDAAPMGYAIQMANSGERDALSTQTYNLTEEYPYLIQVPEPISEVEFQAYAKEGSGFEINSWDDLSGLRVGHMYQKTYILNKLPEDISLHVQKDMFQELDEALLNDECDVVITSCVTGQKINPRQGIEKVGVIEKQLTYTYLNKKFEDIVPEVAENLKAIKKDGTYDKIFDRTLWDTDMKKVLHISSYYPDDAGDAQITDELKEVFESQEGIEYYNVPMYPNRFYLESERAKNAYTIIRNIFISGPPDVIIASGDNALSFVSVYYDILFHDIPVVFCGVMEETGELWKVKGAYSGVYENISAADTVELMLFLYPQTKQIYVINDTLETGISFQEAVKNQLQPFAEKLDIVFSEETEMNDLITALEQLPKDSLALMGNYDSDQQNVHLSRTEVQEMICGKSPVPVFTLTNLGSGQVGGKRINTVGQANIAARMALEILKGKSVSEVANLADNPEELNQWEFDLAVMKKYSLSKAQMPAGSVFMNRNLALYETDPVVFKLMLALLVMGILIIIFLIVFSAKINAKKRHLLDMQKNLHTAEEMLQKDNEVIEAKERLEIALAASKAGVWEINLVEGLVSFDQYSARLLEIKLSSPVTVEVFMAHLASIQFNSVYGEHFKYELQHDLTLFKDAKDLKCVLTNGNTRYLTSHTKTLYDKDGSMLRVVGMLMNITNVKKTEYALQQRLEQQELMSNIAQKFVYSQGIDETINFSMGLIGQFMDADWLYVYQYEKENERFSNRHSWGRDGYKWIETAEQYIPEAVAWDNFIVKERTSVYAMENIAVPENSPFWKEGLENYYSFINIPIIIHDRIWGFMGVACLSEPRQWRASDHHLFTLFSGLIANGLRRDIIQNDLYKAEYTLRTVIDNITRGIFWKDVNGVYEGCNEQFASMIDKTSGQIIGKMDLDIFPKERAIKYYEEDKNVFLMDSAYFCAEDVIYSKGERRIIETTKSMVCDNDGHPMRIIGVSEDVTEKRMEQMHMEETLGKLQAIMDNFNGAIWCVNENREFTIMGGRSIIGVDLKNAIGKKCAEVYKDFPIIADTVELTFTEGQQELTINLEKVSTQCSATPLKNTIGQTIGVLFMAIDNTEQFMMHKELEEAIIKAERASNAKSEFLSRMSHEIRTPMNAIIGMTKIAMNSNDYEKMQYCLNKIDAASKGLLDLINQILDMSKIEAEKLELCYRDFDLKEMLSGVYDVISVKLQEKSQDLTIEYLNEFPSRLIGDELRISQVITNLLSNAVKFTPEKGKIKVNIKKTGSTENSTTLLFEVIDNGIGISEEQQSRLFRSFEQADGGIARKYGGTGLGLAICKKIMNLMGGDIWIESALEQGSKFIFNITLQHPVNEDVSQELSDGEMKSLDLSGYTILLVEDMEINREIVMTLMEDTGIRFVCAGNGKEAVAKFSKEPGRFDMILMDIHMPEMDGYEATVRIRSMEIPKAKQIPIIAMTAVAFREDVEKCKSVGMNEHIPKPIDGNALLQRIGWYASNVFQQKS